jgi:hypothetical protein
LHIKNPQCEQVLIACCHDTGYVPELRKYDAQAAEKMTLISSGHLRSDMRSLGFRETAIFEPLFMSSPALQVVQPTNHSKKKPPSPTIVQTQVDHTTMSSSPTASKPVRNSGRLRPIIRNAIGKRIDKNLSVDPNVAQSLKARNLCHWHYLRADCQQGRKCERDHKYPRPLSPAEYDALWYITRQQGQCRRVRNIGNCEDDQCFYGH